MLTLKVEGMSCDHCRKAVTKAVQALDAEAKVTVDLSQGLVNVQSKAAQNAIAGAIEEAGYSIAGTEVSAH